MNLFKMGKAPAERSTLRTAVRRAQTIDPWQRDVIGRLSGAIAVRGNLDLYDLIGETSLIRSYRSRLPRSRSGLGG